MEVYNFLLLTGIVILHFSFSILAHDDQHGIIGPGPFTYKYGDTINLTCRSSCEDSKDNDCEWIFVYEGDLGTEIEKYLPVPIRNQTKCEVALKLTEVNTPKEIRCHCSQIVSSRDSKGLKFKPQPATKPEIVYFTVYQRNTVTPKLNCAARQNQPNFTLAIYEDSTLLAMKQIDNNAGQVMWAFHPYANWTGLYTCKAYNDIETVFRRLEVRKVTKTLGMTCTTNLQCPLPNSNCIDQKCECNANTAERRYNHIEECLPVKSLYEPCAYTEQCQKNDVNAFCDWGYCKCTKFHEDLDGKCNKRLWISDYCTADAECSASVRNSECNVRYGTGHCECQIGFWYSHGRCVSHRLFADNKFIKVTGISSLVCLVLLIVFLGYFTCRSARLLFLRQKGEHYRHLVLSTQNLSLNNNVPFKMTPTPEVKSPVNGEINEIPRSPSEIQPKLLLHMNSVSDDPTICVPESIPFIKRHDGSIC